MTWFVLASILGFALFWIVPWAKSLYTQAPRQSYYIGAAIAICAFLLIHFAAGGFEGAFNRLGDGSTARFLLGMILGGGVGFAASQRLYQPIPAQRNDGATQPREGNTALLLSLGFAIILLVLLALVAPHVDRWLLHLTSVKASGVEIQLASIGNTSKAIKPDTREFFSDQTILDNVQMYAGDTEADIHLIEYFGLPDTRYELSRNQNDPDLKKTVDQLEKQLDQLRKLNKAFSDIVSPLAGCVKTAIDNGYNIESARSTLRKIGDIMTQITILQPQKDVEHVQILQKKSEEFLKELQGIPAQIALYVSADQQAKCEEIANKVIGPEDSRNYRNLPHPFGAMSFLLTFLNDNIVALRIIENLQANGAWNFDDINVKWLQVTLMYYRGDSISRYSSVLEDLISTAQKQKAVIKRVTDRCGTTCQREVTEYGPKLKDRAQNAENLAMDFFALGVAEDLANGAKAAEARLPTALVYAKNLKEAVSTGKLELKNNPDYLDTVALLTIVSEARKPEILRDVKKIQGAIEDLELLISQQEQAMETIKAPSKLDYLRLAQFRAHLNSAKGLIE